jgi:ABC-2 type transport system ATP-binding protein
MALEPVVRVENLRKSYGCVHALRGISFEVRAGEIFGLLGPNGAGKSTLIKTLIGSSRPTGGSLTVLGSNPFADARTVRRRIGYMPQTPVLYEDLSGRDNVRFFGQAHGGPDLQQRVANTLELTGLQARAGDPVYSLSGGMKQRVSLACALVHGPRLLMLDEPTAGVDPRLREAFWRHFRQLAERDVTLLVSTHQMDEAVLCDRLAILRDGVVLACDTPRHLLDTGRATIRVYKGDVVQTVRVADYAGHLPRLLQRYNLDAAVTRIEVEQDTLDTIVLELIRKHEEADDVRD